MHQNHEAKRRIFKLIARPREEQKRSNLMACGISPCNLTPAYQLVSEALANFHGHISACNQPKSGHLLDSMALSSDRPSHSEQLPPESLASLSAILRLRKSAWGLSERLHLYILCHSVASLSFTP